MNFRSDVSSFTSRPIEAMVCINEIGSAKSVADVKTSYSVTEAKLQTNFEVLDSKIASSPNRIIDGNVKRKVFIQEEAGQSHG